MRIALESSGQPDRDFIKGSQAHWPQKQRLKPVYGILAMGHLSKVKSFQGVVENNLVCDTNGPSSSTFHDKSSSMTRVQGGSPQPHTPLTPHRKRDKTKKRHVFSFPHHTCSRSPTRWLAPNCAQGPSRSSALAGCRTSGPRAPLRWSASSAPPTRG